MRQVKTLMLCAALLALSASVALAGPQHRKQAAASCNKCADTYLRNPDGRTSITLTAGIGDINGFVQDGKGDLKAFGVAIVYPATQNLSLLARYDHGETDLTSPVPRYWSPTIGDWHTNLYTVGVRFYLGK